MDKRKQLIDTAARLFAEQGYRATGIDQIAREAQVTKKTMYRYFSSKDELVIAVLKYYEAIYSEGFVAQLTAAPDDPRERLLGIFDLAYHWFASDDYAGCMLINAVAEHGSPAVREICQSFKKLERDYIETAARAAGASNAPELANALALLFEGAIVTAQVSGQADAAKTAKKAAAILLDQAVLKKR